MNLFQSYYIVIYYLYYNYLPIYYFLKGFKQCSIFFVLTIEQPVVQYRYLFSLSRSRIIGERCSSSMSGLLAPPRPSWPLPSPLYAREDHARVLRRRRCFRVGAEEHVTTTTTTLTELVCRSVRVSGTQPSKRWPKQHQRCRR